MIQKTFGTSTWLIWKVCCRSASKKASVWSALVLENVSGKRFLSDFFLYLEAKFCCTMHPGCWFSIPPTIRQEQGGSLGLGIWFRKLLRRICLIDTSSVPCWFPWKSFVFDGKKNVQLLTLGWFNLRNIHMVRFLFLVCLVFEWNPKNADMAAWFQGVSFSQRELDQIIGWLQEFQEMPILFSDEYFGSQGPTKVGT